MYTVAQLAEICGGLVRGDGATAINGVGTPETAGPDQLSFVARTRYLRHLSSTRAGAVLLTPEHAAGYAGTAILVDNPHLAFARLAAHLCPPPVRAGGVHETAWVDASASVAADAWVGPQAAVLGGAQIGSGCQIGAGAVVGERARIGRGTRLGMNVVIADDCEVGERCTINPGAVIGGDGFGFARDGDAWHKVPQLGRVLVGDDVEIGANTTVDRGAIDDTVIGRGVKIDNLVQIAHNVRVGENTAIAASAAIAGSARIGKRCEIGGMAGIMGHLEICDDVTIAGKSMVSKSIGTPGVYASSLRVDTLENWQRIEARLRQLDNMARRLKVAENKIEELKKE